MLMAFEWSNYLCASFVFLFFFSPFSFSYEGWTTIAPNLSRTHTSLYYMKVICANFGFIQKDGRTHHYFFKYFFPFYSYWTMHPHILTVRPKGPYSPDLCMPMWGLLFNDDHDKITWWRPHVLIFLFFLFFIHKSTTTKLILIRWKKAKLTGQALNSKETGIKNLYRPTKQNWKTNYKCRPHVGSKERQFSLQKWVKRDPDAKVTSILNDADNHSLSCSIIMDR